MFQDRIGFMASLAYSKMAPAAVVQDLKQLGYNSVEWTMAHFHPRTKSPQELQELVEVTKEAGLAISEVVIQQDYICLDDALREDRVRLTIETIDACAQLGISTVNLFSGPAPWDPRAPRIPRDISEGAAWEMARDTFGRLVRVLENHKVHGALEGVWGQLCHDFFSTRLLIDHFNSPYLGVNFDPSHDVLYGHCDTGWLVRQWGRNRIKHVHLKDAVGIPEEGQFLFPMLGEGNVDWKGMFKALVDIEYSGYLSVEFESFRYHQQVWKNDTRQAARRSIEDIRALLPA
jgi:sugar phosphate isomerase/epimerase